VELKRTAIFAWEKLIPEMIYHLLSRGNPDEGWLPLPAKVITSVSDPSLSSPATGCKSFIDFTALRKKPLLNQLIETNRIRNKYN